MIRRNLRLIVLIILVIIIIFLGINSKSNYNINNEDRYLKEDIVNLDNDISGHYRNGDSNIYLYQVNDKKLVYKLERDSKYKVLTLSSDNYYTGDIKLLFKDDLLYYDNKEYSYIDEVTSTSVFNELFDSSVGFDSDSLCNGYFKGMNNYGIYLISQINNDDSLTCNIYFTNTSSFWVNGILNDNKVKLNNNSIKIDISEKLLMADFINNKEVSGIYKKKNDIDINSAIMLRIQTM